MTNRLAKGFWRKVKILGLAVSIGQPKKGVERTPQILLDNQISNLFHPQYEAEWIEILDQQALIEEWKQKLALNSPTIESPENTLLEEEHPPKIKNLGELNYYMEHQYKSILRNISSTDFLLSIGGDHSIASGTISASLKVHKGNLSVIWIDAHGDCNTPDISPSGNYHGMPLAHVFGLFKKNPFSWMSNFLPIQRCVQIGIRDLDGEEEKLMKSIGLKYFTASQVRNYGIQQVIKDSLAYIDPENNRNIHLSVDVDGFDPTFVPGTGTLAPNGLLIEDYSVVIDEIKKCGERFSSMDLVEVNFQIEKEQTLKAVKEILKLTFSD